MNGIEVTRPASKKLASTRLASTRLPLKRVAFQDASLRILGLKHTARVALGVLLAGLLLFSSAVQAQDNPADQFAEVFGRWNATNLELEQLGEELQAATNPEVRTQVRETLLAKFQTLKQMVSELRNASIAAYQAAPNQSPEVIEVLMRLAATDLQEDRVDLGNNIIRLLLENRANARGVMDLAGLGSYLQDDFVNAKEFWTQAKEENAISKGSSDLFKEIDLRIKDFEAERLIRERENLANDLPVVQFETSKGNITLLLYEDQAPNAVANFITLVESGYYDGLRFHRVLSGFMAQGGCNIGDGTGGPGYEIACECYRPDFRKHFRGTLSMAHAGKDTGGSQFFLTFRATPHLDGMHTAFGRVVEGLDVLAELQRIDPNRPSQIEPDRIIRASVIRKRDHAYTVQKIR